MRMTDLKAILKTAVLGATVLLLGAGVARAQVNLIASPTTVTMPDGSTVPMWGYFCVSSTAPTTCTALNPASVVPNGISTWSPILITVPYSGTSTSLTINLTNNLSFTPTTVGATANPIPTSIMIVGQIGGGLGVLAQRTTTLSPDHTTLSSDTVTWPIAGSAASLVPPPQGPRVQSFGTEVAPGAATPTALTWSHLKPGTYLLESGTHPSIQVPMGLYGILVVTAAPTLSTTATTPTESAPGCAY